MANNFGDATVAGELARKAYDLSTECLMAHSIRAVEKYLRDTYNFDTQIVLEASKEVLSDVGRMSWCSVAENSGDLTYIWFQYDPEWDRSRKRFCIAHELYHVIWSVGTASKVPRNKAVESTCDVFANDLCKFHDKFYDDQAKIQNLNIRFQGLPYRSV
jgi:hypothetical protein